MAQLIKIFPSKHEDLNSIPRAYGFCFFFKSQWYSLIIPIVGRWRLEGSWVSPDRQFTSIVKVQASKRGFTSEFKNQVNGVSRLTSETVFQPPHAHKHIDLAVFPSLENSIHICETLPNFSAPQVSHSCFGDTPPQHTHRAINKLSHLAPIELSCVQKSPVLPVCVALLTK